MQFRNPFQMPNWEIKKFIVVILSLQLAVLGLVGLDYVGLDLPIVRQIVTFIFLTFVPGMLVVRIFRLSNLNDIEVVLYSVGISLSCLMLIGFGMLAIYPLFGIRGPISLIPLLVTISTFTVALSVIVLIMERSFQKNTPLCLKPTILIGRNMVLPLCTLFLLPIISVIGTYIFNHYGINILQWMLIIIICALIFLVACDKFTHDLYPVAIFSIAIALMLRNSLISYHLIEWADLSVEFYHANSALIYSTWSPDLFSNVSAMLSIVFLAPTYSLLSKLELLWVFKIIYPIIYSLITLGIYQIVQRQTDNKIAFFSCMFFIFMSAFFIDMLGLNRQQIGEFFVILLMLLILDRKIFGTKKMILCLLFGFSIVVSHYALTYIFILLLICSLTLSTLLSNNSVAFPKLPLMWGAVKSTIQGAGYYRISKSCNPITRPLYVAIMVLFTVIYYIYINLVTFRAAINISNRVISNALFDLGVSNSNQVFEILLTSSTGYAVTIIHKVFNIMVIMFICVGIIGLLFGKYKHNFDKAYFFFVMGAFMLCITGVVVPNIASILNASRLFHISLLFLAPFCVLGGLLIIKSCCKRMNRTSFNTFQPLAIVLILYLLLNAGIVNYIADEPNSNSFSLDKNMLRPNFNDQEVSTVNWLLSKKDNESQVLSDLFYAYLIQSYSGLFQPLKGKDNVLYNSFSYGTYIFLGTENVVERTVWVDDPDKPRLNRAILNIDELDLYQTLQNKNKIQNSGYCEVYY